MKIIEKKRRRQGKTNYLKRKRLLESGSPRIVIRKTNKYITLQYIESEIAEDRVKFTVSSKDLLKQGWPADKAGSLKSLAACYLTGMLLGKRIAGESKGKKIIIDTGLIRSTRGSRVYAALNGVIDSGIKINHDPKMFPEEGKINNDKVKDFFDKVKGGLK